MWASRVSTRPPLPVHTGPTAIRGSLDGQKWQGPGRARSIAAEGSGGSERGKDSIRLLPKKTKSGSRRAWSCGGAPWPSPIVSVDRPASATGRNASSARSRDRRPGRAVGFGRGHSAWQRSTARRDPARFANGVDGTKIWRRGRDAEPPNRRAVGRWHGGTGHVERMVSARPTRGLLDWRAPSCARRCISP